MTFERKSLPLQHYVYVEIETPMAQIGEAMGPAFGQVFGWLGAQGITPTSMPMSVYFEMADPLKFRAGAMVSEADAAKASGPILADVLPTDAVAGLHTGSYAGLGNTHQALWSHMESAGLTPAMPVWEVYVDDPGSVAEEALRTEVYRAIG